MRPVIVSTGLAALLAVGAACSPTNTPASGGQSGRPFTVNWAASISSLDPAFVCPGDDNSLASNFYGRLVKLSTTQDGDGFATANPDPSKVRPDFATSWQVSGDGKTYTFKLPAGKKFANGDPLDASAVKYSLERTVNMGACGALSLQLGITDPPLVQSVEAPDATTVVLHLRQAYPAILYSLAQSRGSIYDPKLIEANGGTQPGKPNQWLTSHTASSSGPYVLKEYVPGSYAVLERNPNYYGTPARESSVRINFITSVPTLLLQAENGQADVTLGLPPQSVKNLSQKNCCKVVSASSSTPVTVSLNHNGPVTDNVKFRAALTYAVPYSDIISKVAYGYGDSYYGPVVPGMAGYNQALEPARAYDPAKAKQILADSGVKSPQLELMINPTAPGVSDIATLLQSAWQNIGVKVNIVAKPPTDFSTLFNDGKYQSALLFENSTPIGGYELRKKLTCGSHFNNQHICIPGSMPLLQQLNNTADAAKQQPIVDQLVKLWVANSPTIILYRARFTAVLGKDVKQFEYAANTRIADWGR
ncbi:peptide/nickel transport system substrate-binding protein [Kribbella aluminosa]|uniref:Peptide/nickel transport system substrate-binding protein n=1 Tax=Kribbella aluminosa TaxID=416017 RepID=A0ABS4UJL6_9ACTN|nr:ABC transporter substrate-binding protein [Kribbella aluminosa]MBP2351833.1 peptide/nickel transport system substrate-binding protein [Kribbella aluminosa]